MPIRAAATVVLLCVGILLLSACGLPLLLPPAHPDVYADTFALWQQTDQGTLIPIGWGAINGDTENVRVELRLVPPSCLTGQIVEFAGKMLRTHAPTLHLAATPQGGGTIFLDAGLRSQPVVYGVNALPLQGTLTFEGGCTGARTIKVRAEEKPMRLTSFFGIAQAPAHTGIQISETWNTEGLNPSHFYQFNATLLIKSATCPAHGQEISTALISPNPFRFVITYQMDDQSTITGEITFDTHHPRSPRSELYTIEGGPCDGESFNAMLYPF